MNNGGVSSALRIAVITAIPTPYRDPFWNVINKLPEIDIEVIYCARQKGDRPWSISWEQNYVAHYPKSLNIAKKLGPAASVYWNPDIRTILSSGRYDGIIIGGYNHPSMLWAIWFARRHKIPYFLASESYLGQKRSGWKQLLKHRLVRSIVTKAKGCFPTGKLASEYLIHYGAHPDRLCLLPNIPDVDRFYQDARRLSRDRANIRERLGIKKRCIIFVGRFIEMKGGHFLIRAFKEIVETTEPNSVELVMLGDGPKRADWESIVAEEDLSDLVRFPGFQAPEALPEWFAAADVLCLPSTNETWSVVVLEALSSGLPVVITNRVGCYANAITGDRVGQVVDAGQVESLVDGLKKQLALDLSREEMFTTWKATRESFSYATVAKRTSKALLDWCR